MLEFIKKHLLIHFFPQYLKNINGDYYKDTFILLVQNVRFPRSLVLLCAYALTGTSPVSDTTPGNYYI